MSTVIQDGDEPQVSDSSNDIAAFIDWHNTLNDEPTEEEEQAARERTLALGNETSVGEPDDVERTAKYDKLDSHNRDNYWKYRDDVKIWESADTEFKRKTLLAFAHQVSLSPLQRQMALTRFLELDLPRCGLRTELIAFAVCAVVLNEDAENYFGERKPYYPTRNPENNHSAFVTLQKQLTKRWGRITESQILSAYQKVKQRSLPTTYKLPKFEEEVQLRPSYSPDWTVSEEG